MSRQHLWQGDKSNKDRERQTNVVPKEYLENGKKKPQNKDPEPMGMSGPDSSQEFRQNALLPQSHVSAGSQVAAARDCGKGTAISRRLTAEARKDIQGRAAADRSSGPNRKRDTVVYLGGRSTMS